MVNMFPPRFMFTKGIHHGSQEETLEVHAARKDSENRSPSGSQEKAWHPGPEDEGVLNGVLLQCVEELNPTRIIKSILDPAVTVWRC